MSRLAGAEDLSASATVAYIQWVWGYAARILQACHDIGGGGPLPWRDLLLDSEWRYRVIYAYRTCRTEGTRLGRDGVLRLTAGPSR